MSHFLKQGNSFRVIPRDSIDMREKLPAGNYSISKDPMSGELFLTMVEGFEIKGKLYGNVLRHTNRILHTFHDRPNNTGILLSGEKGSGKTLLAKNLSMMAAEAGIPTVVINAAWKGDAFNQLIQSIDQPCIVLFDEFEKVYEREDQDEILTLMDGVYQTKKLFILTCNDKWRVNEHMKNRPGRIYYYLEFKGLEQEFIEEYCQDNLVNKDHIPTICNVASAFDSFNFDMLKSMVEEMNRYDESPQEVLEMLNARPEYSERSNYAVTLRYQGQEVGQKNLCGLRDGKYISANPFNGVSIECYGLEKDIDGDDEFTVFEFTPDQIQHVNANDGSFVFFNQNKGVELRLTRKEESSFDFWRAF